MENSDVREEDETTTFNDLGLCETLIEACKKLGWQRPSRIQREAIPQALAGKDILGLAETGSGKTGAFALPIVHQLLSQLSTLSVLVLTPTRELAHQMHQQFVHLTTGSALKTMLLIGGMEAVDQVIELAKKPHIIIATPGRMLEHLQNTKGFNLNNLRFLVLDEADKILNMDFEEEVTEIMKLIGKKRQAFLFSATMTNKVAKLQKACLRDPTKVEVSFKYKTPYTLIQRYLLVPNKHKEVYLFYLIKHLFKNKNTTTANNKKNNGNNENNNSTNNNRNNNVNNNNNNNQTSIIIFCNTCIKTVLISRTLKHLNFNSIFLHGQLSQSKRLECLQKFRDFRKNILVATDVASRGLDIPGVDAVINYDLPDHNKDYFHRVGRTARAGKSGQAFSIVTQYDIKELLGIEGLLESEMDAVEFDKKEALRCQEEVYEAKKIAKRELAELEKRKSQKDSKKVAKRKGNDEDDEEEDDGDHDDAAGVRRKFKKSF